MLTLVGSTVLSERIVTETHRDAAAAELGRIGDVARVVVGVRRTDTAGNASGTRSAQLPGKDIVLHSHLGRGDMVQLIVFYLLAAPAVGLAYGSFHRRGNLVRIHNHQAVHIAPGPSRSLGQSPFGTEETLLVSIQDSHQRH